MNFASDKARFRKIKLKVTNLPLKVLSAELFINFVFFCSLLHAIVTKFANTLVHDSCIVRRHLKKNCIVTRQAVKVGLR